MYNPISTEFFDQLTVAMQKKRLDCRGYLPLMVKDIGRISIALCT